MAIYRRNNKKGFTLVEVLLTGAILAFGIVSIYESLFVSVDVHGYYRHYLNVHDWINEKIWKAQSQLIDSGELDDGQTAGQIVREHKTYDWQMSVALIDEREGLYRVNLRLSWKEGRRTFHTERETYLMPSELKIYGDPNSSV